MLSVKRKSEKYLKGNGTRFGGWDPLGVKEKRDAYLLEIKEHIFHGFPFQWVLVNQLIGQTFAVQLGTVIRKLDSREGSRLTSTFREDGNK